LALELKQLGGQAYSAAAAVVAAAGGKDHDAGAGSADGDDGGNTNDASEGLNLPASIPSKKLILQFILISMLWQRAMQ
jgi:hypothetical protein